MIGLCKYLLRIITKCCNVGWVSGGGGCNWVGVFWWIMVLFWFCCFASFSFIISPLGKETVIGNGVDASSYEKLTFIFSLLLPYPLLSFISVNLFAHRMIINDIFQFCKYNGERKYKVISTKISSHWKLSYYTLN